MAIIDEPYLAADSTSGFAVELFPELATRVCLEIESSRPTRRGLSAAHRDEERRAAAWILGCLFEASEAIPSIWLAVAKHPEYFGPHGPLKGAYGYKVVVKRIIPALKKLGWIDERRGYFFRSTKSMVTRIKASGFLADVFQKKKYFWVHSTQTDLDLIQIYDGNKESRVRISTPSNPDTKQWHDNLFRYNEFLLRSSICLNRSDAALMALETEIKARWKSKTKIEKSAVNFRRVCLKRIFSRGGLDKGGRFYGGWWQSLPSEYRQWIVINGKKTSEYDFASMSIRILAAKEGVALGSTDTYDLGLVDTDGSKRKIVKEFINAMLNDEDKTYRLSKEKSDILGLKRKDLLTEIEKRMPWLPKHFCTGVGLRLQFEDSKIAEKVMLNMMDHHLVPVLPVHDSFIVRSGYKTMLESEMQQAFKDVTGVDAVIKAEPRTPHPDRPSVTAKGFFRAHDVDLDSFSIVRRFTDSNPEAKLD